MTEDVIGALRALANRWALKARDLAREAKTPGTNPETAAYNRGYAEGMYKAATELAEAIKGMPAVPLTRPAARANPDGPPQEPNRLAGGRWNSPSSDRPNAPSSSASAGSASGSSPGPSGRQGTQPAPASAPPEHTYAEVQIGEVLALLQVAGTTPRDIQLMPGNVFRAIFSRWEDLTPPQRQQRVTGADHRLIILETGFTRDTRDPYIDFAFKEPL